MNGPLSGLRVVVLAGMGPTPFTSMLLADLGAEVVRIAPPPSRRRLSPTPADGIDAQYDVVNRGVTSVELDLKDPADVDAALALITRAEVFIEGFRPGVAERLGLGPDVLLNRLPNLVYARLTGYGQDGPLAQAAGHDINYVAQSGALNMLRRPGAAPHPPINLLGDYAGGGALAAFGIVAGVLWARQTGIGQVIDSAMIDGVAILTTKLLGLHAAGLFAGEPGTNYLDGGAPYYDTYQCADGRYIAVGALEHTFYQAFLDGLEVDTSDWPAQLDRAEWSRLRELIGQVVGRRTRDEWAAAFAGTDACVTPVLDFEEAARDPHNAAREMFRRVGTVLHPVPSPRFSGTPARPPEAPHDESVSITDVLRSWGASLEPADDVTP
ncbi:MAG: CoA transferase [Microbacteriaceae bacterium]|nr:MAG: CoA transferase [Microbacteriaceae bacterium]